MGGPVLAARGERKGRWDVGLARWAEKREGEGRKGVGFPFFPNLFKH
jgi:hypothetical protein